MSYYIHQATATQPPTVTHVMSKHKDWVSVNMQRAHEFLTLVNCTPHEQLGVKLGKADNLKHTHMHIHPPPTHP